MSLFDSASLVVTPSGYKEDKLYSIKPTDGSGDLVVTRATTATRVNSDGLIEECPYNFLQQSQTFDNAAWNKIAVGGASIPAVTANSTTAPDGNLTADKIVFNAPTSGDISVLDQNISLTGTATGSFYIKAFSSTDIGKIIGFRFNSSSYSLVTLTDSWQRVSVTATALSTFDIHLRPAIGTSSGTVSIYLWGAQLVSGTSAKEYFPTTDRLNVPRLDYTNSSCPSILVEPQRTNLLTYSEQFDNAAWVKTQLTVTANATISPSGVQNADKLIPSNVNSFHNLYNFATALTGSYVFSVFAKKGGYNFLNLQDQFGGIFNSCFDLNNGTFTTYAGSASIKSFDNDWYLCTVIGSGSGVTAIPSIIPSNSTSSFPIFVGNGTDGIFVWGAQFEAGSYATSYIPTAASSVTRNADVISKTGISSLIGQTEGTFFVEFNYNSINDGTTSRKIISLNDGSSTNLIDAYIQQGATSLQARLRNGGVGIGAITSGALSSGNYKLAYAYKNSDFVLYINGTQIGAVSSGTISFTSPVEIVQIGDGESAGDQLGGLIKSTVLWKTRLSNTELASLTSL